jgi:hypothetical protein
MLHQVGPCNLSLRITRRIVARLSRQILEILKQCNVSKDIQDKVGDLHINSLLKIPLRCWEIEPYRLSLLCAERCAISAHPSISSIPLRYSNSLEC